MNITMSVLNLVLDEFLSRLFEKGQYGYLCTFCNYGITYKEIDRIKKETLEEFEKQISKS